MVSHFVATTNLGSEVYIKNTTPTLWAQSDNQEIISRANLIVGSLIYPYEKAKALHAWVTDYSNIGPPDNDGNPTPIDALATLQNGRSDCAGHSNLFVAFCRALGIPARNVAGYLPSIASEDGTFQSGTFYPFNQVNDLGSHVWAEFYLEGYGWIQCDPSGQTLFPFIRQERIILSKVNDIILEHDHFCNSDNSSISGELSWFHLPRTPCQDHFSGKLWLKVEPLIDDVNLLDGKRTLPFVPLLLLDG